MNNIHELHKSLSRNCSSISPTFIEFRKERGIVAFFDCCLSKDPVKEDLRYKKFPASIYLALASRLKANCYIVFHNHDLSIFNVFKAPVLGEKDYLNKYAENEKLYTNTMMDKQTFCAFIEGL